MIYICHSMKQAFISFLSFWILLGSFMPHGDMEEIAKIPLLIQHFQEHKAQSKTPLSFTQFLKDHYGDETPTGADHENLPFVKHSLPGLVYILPDFTVEFSQTFQLLTRTGFPEPVLFFSNPVSGVWQPPRLV